MAIFRLFGLNLSICGLIHSWSSFTWFIGHFWPYFSVFGVGAVSELSQTTEIYINPETGKLTTTVWSLKSTRLRGWWSSLACMPWVCLLCQHVCQHASMPGVCQHARGSSQKCLSFPEVPEGPRCPEGQDIVPLCQMAQNPQDCTYGIIFTWNDDICIVKPLMWWPIGCGYCQKVLTVYIDW